MSRTLSVMVTLYLLLRDFVKTPFIYTKQEGDWKDSFVIEKDDNIEILVSEKLISFYVNHDLIFTINTRDTVSLKTGMYQVITPTSTHTLEHLIH